MEAPLKLGKTHRPIALDLLGYALSDKPLEVTYDYDLYADALDIRDTHLCAHDLVTWQETLQSTC